MVRHATVQKTLFFSYFVPILLTIVILSVLFFTYTSRILRAEEEANLTDLTDKMASIIDSEISRLNNISLNITNSALLKDYIKEYIRLRAEGRPPESLENYIAARDISNMLAEIAGPIKTVPQINYIDPGRLLIGAGTYNLFHQVPLETAEAISGIDRKYGKRHFSGIIRDPLAENAFPLYKNQQYISLYRTIFNELNEPLGIIEVKQFAETIFYGPSRAPRNFMIFDSGGTQLFPQTVSSDDTYAELLEHNSIPGIYSYYNKLSQSREIVSVGKCREINWTILNLTEESVILAPVYRFFFIILISGIVMFVTSIMVARRFSGLITQSLQQLNGWISNLHWDNLSSETPSDLGTLTPLAEFEDIHMEFWRMNRKLHDSMKLVVQERSLQENARMLALQSQMDPHFMYNMLATIGIMAEDGETENIVDTISHLTAILRYTASRSRLYVGIEEEFEISEKFLKCIRVRYADDLRFQIDIDPDVSRALIPKLSVLPLVENSIKYMTKGEPPWIISLRAGTSGSGGKERWEILVEDTGPGFDGAAMKKINEMISCCDENAENQLGFHFDGLGLPNIYSRMKIYFRDDFEFKVFNSEISGGACVRLGGPIGK